MNTIFIIVLFYFAIYQKKFLWSYQRLEATRKTLLKSLNSDFEYMLRHFVCFSYESR